MQPHQPPPNVDPAAMVLTLVIVLALIVLPAYLVVKLIDHMRGRNRVVPGKDHPSPELPEPNKQATPAWLWLLLIGGFVFGLWAYAPKNARPGQPAPASPASLLISIPVVVVGAFLLWFAIAWIRALDKVVSRATKLLRDGNPDEAFALVAEAMDQKPTATRANLLGVILMNRGDWPGAYKWLLQAQELGLSPRIASTNMCLILQNLGRFSDAIELIEPYALAPKATLLEVCNYANALIDAGRLDDARAQIHRGEEMLARGQARISAPKQSLRELHERCRLRYEEHSAARKAATAQAPDPLSESE